ncbi:MAG: endolytic transglycosylase MltG [Desulfitobacterium sp.]|nr:endolytic transglycosylase MltG [Desulfitobacterium sp.]
MKISRSYLMGLGSGFILSALIALIMPPITINFGSTPSPPQQGVIQEEEGANQKEPNQPNQDEPNEEESNQGTLDGVKGEGEAGAEKNIEAEKDAEGEKGTFVIPRGSTASQVAELLFEEEWISSKEEFMAVVEEKNLARKFRAGTFQLTKGLNIDELLDELIH